MAEREHRLLECRGISKGFPGVQALADVNFSVESGKVHGLVGANGAGKSTLFRILAGVHEQDRGEMFLDGTPYQVRDTQDAIDQGVVTIHQDVNLIDSLTVEENILLNNELTFPFFGLLNRRATRRYVLETFEHHGIEIDPTTVVSQLPNDQKKLIQILRAISLNARVLLMDEPTSSLTEEGIRIVHELIRKLAQNGVAVVFISHYLSEVFEVCNDITVLRDGRVVAKRERKASSVAEIVVDMLGKALSKPQQTDRDRRIASETALSVRGLSIKGRIHDISFDLRKGEILGATGIVGSGLQELSKALFGFAEGGERQGEVSVAGGTLPLTSPFNAVGNGVALLTNDRLKEGILPGFPIYENICLPVLKRFRNSLGLIDRDQMVATGEASISRLSIKAGSAEAPISTLSGGNQQKVLLAKWLETKPSVFILDEPTIGIDVGSKEEIRAIVRSIAAEGVGVLLLTAEYEELELMCDRVLVMFRGRIIAEFEGDDVQKDRIVSAALGGET
jgi:ABC-type sugar transport system ATPase subunit